MDSKIKTKEEVLNKDRKFGGADSYYPCIIEDNEGGEHKALFTFDQLKVAMERADRNPEDVAEAPSFWDHLLLK